MSKTKLGSNAQITGTGEGLTTIGKHCYAYSGASSITSGGYRTILHFTTGKGYILADFQISSFDFSGSDLYYKIEINGVEVMGQFANNAYQTYPYGFAPIQLLIPPNSVVTVKGQRGSGSDYDVYALIRGEIIDG